MRLIDAKLSLAYNFAAGEVLELADRRDLGSRARKSVWVRPPPSLLAYQLGSSGKKVSDLSFHPLCGGTQHHLLYNYDHHLYP